MSIHLHIHPSLCTIFEGGGGRRRGKRRRPAGKVWLNLCETFLCHSTPKRRRGRRALRGAQQGIKLHSARWIEYYFFPYWCLSTRCYGNAAIPSREVSHQRTIGNRCSNSRRCCRLRVTTRARCRKERSLFMPRTLLYS